MKLKYKPWFKKVIIMLLVIVAAGLWTIYYITENARFRAYTTCEIPNM